MSPVADNEQPELDQEEEIRDADHILRWRKAKRGRRTFREFLVLWRGESIDDASWVREEDFVDPQELEDLLRRDDPLEDIGESSRP